MVLHDYFAGKHLVTTWSNLFYIDKDVNNEYLVGNIPLLIKKSPLIAIISGSVICLFVYFVFSKKINLLKTKLRLLINIFEKKLFIDELYNFLFVKTSFYLGKGFWKSIDIDLIDNLGPNGISRLVGSFGRIVSKLQSGFLYHYVLSVVIGLTLPC